MFITIIFLTSILLFYQDFFFILYFLMDPHLYNNPDVSCSAKIITFIFKKSVRNIGWLTCNAFISANQLC